MRKLYGLFISVFFFAACSIFPTPSGSVAKYLLTCPSITLTQVSCKNNLVIAQPSLATVLQDHNRVVYLPTAQKVEFIAEIEWANRLDLMILESLIELFKTNRKYRSVDTEIPALADTDYTLLKTHVLLLGIRQIDAKRYAQAVYEFSYYDKTNKLLSRKRVEKMIPLSGTSLDSLAEALNRTHQQAILDLID